MKHTFPLFTIFPTSVILFPGALFAFTSSSSISLNFAFSRFLSHTSSLNLSQRWFLYVCVCVLLTQYADVMCFYWAALHTWTCIWCETSDNVYPGNSFKWLFECPSIIMDSFQLLRKRADACAQGRPSLFFLHTFFAMSHYSAHQQRMFSEQSTRRFFPTATFSADLLHVQHISCFMVKHSNVSYLSWILGPPFNRLIHAHRPPPSNTQINLL